MGSVQVGYDYGWKGNVLGATDGVVDFKRVVCKECLCFLFDLAPRNFIKKNVS